MIKNSLIDLMRTAISFCFNNGVYDLSKSQFRKGTQKDYLSLCTNTDYKEYDPKDKSLIELNKYFEQVFIDEDIREYVKLLLCSYIQGHTPDEKFHIWTGTGANSKSKLIELFSNALGGYAGIFPVSLLTQKRSACGVASPEIGQSKRKKIHDFFRSRRRRPNPSWTDEGINRRRSDHRSTIIQRTD